MDRAPDTLVSSAAADMVGELRINVLICGIRFAPEQGSRLHGLNATRAWCWRQIASALPAGDARAEPAQAAARQHAKAVLPYVLGGDYQLEHWLAAYAVLMLS